MSWCDSELQDNEIIFISVKGPKCKESMSGKITNTRDNFLRIKKVVRNIDFLHASHHSTMSTVSVSVTKNTPNLKMINLKWPKWY